jgi:hypothetical protein
MDFRYPIRLLLAFESDGEREMKLAHAGKVVKLSVPALLEGC